MVLTEMFQDLLQLLDMFFEIGRKDQDIDDVDDKVVEHISKFYS